MVVALLLFYLPVTLTLFNREREPVEWLVLHVAMATFYTAIFCINYFWLVPRLIVRTDRMVIYLLANMLIIMGVCALIPVWFETHGGLPHPPDKAEGMTTFQYALGYFRFILRDSVMMVLSAGLAYALRFSREHERIHKRELELKAERRKVELQGLKAQLNPHFLFNSLNNIYALIGFAPDRAQEALHDLSGMLRYMIYDSTSPTVSLDKERLFIMDYVRLMQLRMSSGAEVNCDMPESAIDKTMRIAPLIFLTLVENAFKHSAPADDGKLFINLAMATEGDRLLFTARNSYSCRANTLNGSSGVGLENVRRQLNLLYPDSHSFTWGGENGIFTARIAIDLASLRITQTDNK